MELQSFIYQFKTSILGKDKIIRKVKISLINASKEALKYQLLCLKYVFDEEQISSCLKQITYLFNEVMVSTDLYGTIIEIHELSFLQHRWEKIKSNILKEDSGSELDTYFHSLDLIIYDKEKLISFLSEDTVYGLFFNGLWQQADKTLTYEVQKDIIQKTVTFSRMLEKESSERYVFANEVILEGNKIKDNKQYEILCLGSTE